MPKIPVLFICTEKESYPRNNQILKSLNDNFEVIKISSDKSSYPLRIIEVLTRFAAASLFKNYQLVLTGFLGQPLVPAIRFLMRKTLILDAFVSVYDVLCLDREDFKPDSLIGKIAYLLDALSFRLADKIITDTGPTLISSLNYSIRKGRSFILCIWERMKAYFIHGRIK